MQGCVLETNNQLTRRRTRCYPVDNNASPISNSPPTPLNNKSNKRRVLHDEHKDVRNFGIPGGQRWLGAKPRWVHQAGAREPSRNVHVEDARFQTRSHERYCAAHRGVLGRPDASRRFFSRYLVVVACTHFPPHLGLQSRPPTSE